MPSRRSFIGFFGASAAGAAFFAGRRHGWYPPMNPDPTASATATPTPEPTETTEPTPVETTPAVGSSMPTGTLVSNGTTWTQVYAEDFLTDAALGAVAATYPEMGYYQSGKDTSGYGQYAPSQVLSVSDSTLDFHLRSVNGQPLVASILPDNYAPHTHARVSIRYRADKIPGYKFVGMLWPLSNNWNEGEIDYPEGDLQGTVRPATAIAGTLGQGKGGNPIFVPATEMFAATDQSEFHVATTEWTSSSVRFYWDDTLLAEVTQGVPTTPFRVTLQAETWLNEGAPPQSADGHVEIDWITIYEAR